MRAIYFFIVTKHLLMAGVIVLVSELGKRSDKLGALVAAMRIVTITVLIWRFIENQPTQKTANHAWNTFWYVLPTLPMFLLFPYAIQRLGFWMAPGGSLLFTGSLLAINVWTVRHSGIESRWLRTGHNKS